MEHPTRADFIILEKRVSQTERESKALNDDAESLRKLIDEMFKAIGKLQNDRL